MTTMTTCPRGHDLEPNAVYCTVCWMRVEPEDAAIVAARVRRRRRVWIPLFGAGAILVGVGLGGAVALSTQASAPTVVAAAASPVIAEAPPVAQPQAVADEPVAAEPVAAEPLAAEPVAAEPLAATVVEAPQATPGCTAELKDQQATCALDADVATLAVCVPEATSAMIVRTRASADVPWEKTIQDLVPADAAVCADGLVGATVAIDTASADAKLKVVAKDAEGTRLWRSRVAITVTDS